MTTLQLAAVPVRNKSLESLRNALRTMLETGSISRFRTIISDREAAVLSAKFRREVKQSYGAEVIYLKARNKAYAAELALRHLKTHLSMVIEANKEAGEGDFRNWSKHLDKVVENWNNRRVKGTNIRRNAVNDDNFYDCVNALWKSPDASMAWNQTSISDWAIPDPKWKKRIWKFPVGSRVRIQLKALASHSPFAKPSVRGSYSRDTFKITKRFLKSTRKLILTPGSFFVRLLISSLTSILFSFLQSIDSRVKQAFSTRASLRPLRKPHHDHPVGHPQVSECQRSKHFSLRISLSCPNGKGVHSQSPRFLRSQTTQQYHSLPKPVSLQISSYFVRHCFCHRHGLGRSSPHSYPQATVWTKDALLQYLHPLEDPSSKED